MTLTKRDLVLRISEETGQIQLEIHNIIQKTLDYIAEALSKGDKVELRNFGVFYIRARKARVGRNPKRPDVDVPIPRLAVVKFKPGRLMKYAVAKLPPPASKEKPVVVEPPAPAKVKRAAAKPKKAAAAKKPAKVPAPATAASPTALDVPVTGQ
jgi:nucleoid DNA-binding protein